MRRRDRLQTTSDPEPRARLIDRLNGWAWRALSRSERAEVTRYAALVRTAGEHEQRLQGLSDADLSAEAARLRGSAKAGRPPFGNEELVAWCALGREAARRAVGLRAFDVQLLGMARMLAGDVVEMATGEGKTLAGALAAAGFALRGRSVQVLSVNDYLARRDAEWMGPLYRLLGVSVDWVTAESTPAERRDAYAAEVTYASVSEVGFDVLRDRVCTDAAELVAPRPDVALVDEADSVLVDEARVPLVLAGSTEETTPGERMARVVASLRAGRHYQTDTEGRNVFLTPAGERAVEAALGGIDLYAAEQVETITQVNVALHAHVLLHRDVHYLVRDGEIKLISSSRGRVATLQRWPDGLHAAVEAKEGLSATGSGEILDTITIQGLLTRYPTLCGMTGTALVAEEQLRTFYKLSVTVIPPNTPCQRVDEPSRVYTSTAAKEEAVIAEITAAHATGRPILVGTLDVAESERLAALLAERGLACVVLNAKNDAEEAAIIAHAGEEGALTISTQMAGRGTDIRLGGPDGADHDNVAALGGLYVIGTGHHPSRRIDDQLRGRSGRQGDPGGSVFFASLEDEQVLQYGSAHDPSAPVGADGRVEDRAAHRQVAHAQRVAEGTNLTIHSTTWRYNQLIERQRELLGELRDQVLHTDHATELMAQRCPDRCAELRQAVPTAVLDEAARLVVLHHVDRCWADHLAFLADVRESIHLRSLAGQDPLAEFHRTAIPAFKRRLADALTEAADTFERVTITADGIDLDAAGLRRPSATWTYLVNDNPFGTPFERALNRIGRALRGSRSAPAEESSS
ncbi:accessory Sec system translocase SecA2 [Actinopolymorpha pittospori]|uniref:Protein translocase subunit SecA n=1 Tax=Actinopolymorpha pittospori TaxID=648752 RepID=A0A927RQE7_9ACTN|nr:preprotein translocase subunit SecA [Actinopolymorpha pittospori]